MSKGESDKEMSWKVSKNQIMQSPGELMTSLEFILNGTGSLKKGFKQDLLVLKKKTKNPQLSGGSIENRM